MNRRHFLLGTAGAALVGAIPVAVTAAARGSLLDDPAAWIGSHFRLADGSQLELAAVDELSCDRHSSQLRLRFRSLNGVAPAEGIHPLSTGWSEDSLFLQPARDGAVACVNRLHAA
jgi:hypothetical protein